MHPSSSTNNCRKSKDGAAHSVFPNHSHFAQLSFLHTRKDAIKNLKRRTVQDIEHLGYDLCKLALLMSSHSLLTVGSRISKAGHNRLDSQLHQSKH